MNQSISPARRSFRTRSRSRRLQVQHGAHAILRCVGASRGEAEAVSGASRGEAEAVSGASRGEAEAAYLGDVDCDEESVLVGGALVLTGVTAGAAVLTGGAAAVAVLAGGAGLLETGVSPVAGGATGVAGSVEGVVGAVAPGS